MTIVAIVAGVALIVLAARDVFDTLFHPHGHGVISESLARGSWALMKRVGGGRSRLLALAGPFAFSLVVLSWVALVVVGGALIMLPNLPEEYAMASELGDDEVTGALGAVYASFVNLTSLGFGDVVARNDLLRLLGPVQAIIGLAILTASISWILSIYRVLGDYRALARETGTLRDGELATGRPFAALPPESVARTLSGLTTQVIVVRGDFLDFPITYYFYGRDEAGSLPHAIASLLSIVETVRETDPAHSVALEAERLALAIGELLATVDDEFFGSRGAPLEETLNRWRRDHARAA
ncbi:MAG: potassium channel family protein [Solirubrobacterales bacterium]